MPIETRTVLTCGHCGADKAKANGWYLVSVEDSRVVVRPATDMSINTLAPPQDKVVIGLPETDAACGQECAIKMVSAALPHLKYESPKPKEWKRKR